MSRLSRKTFYSGFFHIMIQGIDKEYIFETEQNKEQYMFFMKKYYKDYKIKLIAHCIMDNHAHFIIYSDNIDEISSYMHKINFLYATDYNKKHKRVGYVFRDRYKSQYIYDREYLYKCIKYIHLNPIKANIVKNEDEYKYSSYCDYKNKQGYVDDELIQLVFKTQNSYINLLNNIDDIDTEMMDVDNKKENFETAVNRYLLENNLDLEQISKSKIKLYDFSHKLVKKGYKQKQIADKLNVSPSKICIILRKKKLSTII